MGRCLVGDAPYYGRFGFSVAKTGRLWMPGPYERHRLLAVELVPGRSTARAARSPRPVPSRDGGQTPPSPLRLRKARSTGRAA